MRVRTADVLASAAVAALALPALALGQTPTQTAAPKLSESPTSGFPDQAYLLTLPKTQALNTSNVDVTENGGPVIGPRRRAPGRRRERRDPADRRVEQHEGRADPERHGGGAGVPRGAQGRPARRRSSSSAPTTASSRDFTTDRRELTEAVAQTPATSEGTHIYDALINAIDKAKDQGLERTTVVLLSDGTDVGSRCLPRRGAAGRGRRERPRDLRRPQLARSTTRRRSRASRTARAASTSRPPRPAELQPIFQEIGQQLSSEYEVTYRSLLPPQRRSGRPGQGRRLAPATAKYTTPALDLAPAGHVRAELDRRGDHVAVAHGLRRRRGARAHRVRDLLRDRRPQPLAPAPHGAVRHGPERGGVAPAPRRGRLDARGHRAAHGRRPALVAALRDGRRARRLQPLGTRHRRLDDRRRDPRVASSPRSSSSRSGACSSASWPRS